MAEDRPCARLLVAVFVLHRSSRAHQGVGFAWHHGRAAAGAFSRHRRIPRRRPTEPHHPRRAARRARRSARDRDPGPRCRANRGSGQAAGAALRPQPAPPDLLRKLPNQRNDSSGSGPELIPGAPPTGERAAHPSLATPAHRADAAGGIRTAGSRTRASLRWSGGKAAADRSGAPRPEGHGRCYFRRRSGGGSPGAVAQAARGRTGGGAARVPAHHPGARTGSPPRLRQEDLGEGASAGESIRPGRRSARGWTRDGGQCAFVGSTGQRCPPGINSSSTTSTLRQGGPPTTANLTLRCRAHNRHQAEQDFGREHIARKSAARYAGEGVKGAPAGCPK